MSAMLHAAVPLFHSVFIMSQASTTMAVTTTHLVIVVCSCMSSLLSGYHGLLLDGTSRISGQLEGVLLPPVTPRLSGDVVGLATVPQQQPPSQMPFQAYVN